MKWEEVQKEFPDKFVLLKTLQYHIEKNTKIIDDVALVKVIDNPKEASKMLIRCKGDTFVFHTSKTRLAMNIVINPAFRGIYSEDNL